MDDPQVVYILHVREKKVLGELASNSSSQVSVYSQNPILMLHEKDCRVNVPSAEMPHYPTKPNSYSNIQPINSTLGNQASTTQSVQDEQGMNLNLPYREYTNEISLIMTW